MKRIYINDYCDIRFFDKDIILSIKPKSQEEIIDVVISKDENYNDKTMAESTFEALDDIYVKYIDCNVKLLNHYFDHEELMPELTASYYELNRALRIRGHVGDIFGKALASAENFVESFNQIIQDFDDYQKSVKIFKIVLENDVKQYLILQNDNGIIDIKVDINYKA